jgi:uncharacterized protein with NRDE domain
MCLVAIAWQVHPEFPLILAGNRDELHDRPSAGANWWSDHRHVFGGRDLVAGGSWLGVNRQGQMAVVTNYPGHNPIAVNAPSRGHLVRDYLVSGSLPEDFLGQLEPHAMKHAGFCLFVGNPAQLWTMTSPAQSTPLYRSLEPGVYAVSNSSASQPWPKAIHLKSNLTRKLATGRLETGEVFSLLSRREPVDAGPDFADHDLPWYARMPFVQNTEYGTRASTVVRMDRNGKVSVEERRFDRHGEPAGVSMTSYTIDANQLEAS